MSRYLVFFLVTTILSTVISLECGTTIGYFVVTVLITGLATAILISFKTHTVSYLKIGRLFLVAFIVSYILFYTIAQIERDTAYAKMKAVPKNVLEKFHRTQDLTVLPQEARYAWIGCCYRKITVLNETQLNGKVIQAVGWKQASIAAYYDVKNKEYTGSFH
ncbi:hypothetical protein [Flavobacterium sp. GCM10023249]|uniref:hypothetical protein n=1 Tax=unclassified Flavobacterium TaxID=196869 RepID=UPI00361C63E9